MKALIAVGIAVFLTGSSAGIWYYGQASGPPTTFRTAVVERGNLLAVVTATGTVEPEEAIDIGAQVAGQIKYFGKDPKNPNKTIDFGSEVEEGTVLAQLDDSLYASQVGQAKANVMRAEADLTHAKAKLTQADRDWGRVRRLMSSKGVVSELESDTAQSSFETARANVQVAEASLAQNKELLKQAETNLGYSTIKSPVKGVILDRRVNVGQTVVASLNAPSLFLIAKDLTRLQVWASVNEADIGSIHKNQGVNFTVDTYPNETFKGKVSQIRLNATMTMNVVTYTVVVDTDNTNRRLLPYMTANLQFQVSERDDVLMVPNGALRWRPQLHHVAPEYRDEFIQSLKRKISAHGNGTPTPAERERQGQATLWVRSGDAYVRPLKVRVGLSDGAMTELISGDVQDGTPVIIGATTVNTQEASTNPLMPTIKPQRNK